MDRSLLLLSILAFALSSGATAQPAAKPTERVGHTVPVAAPTCSPDNGGLKLPAGFCAVLVKDKITGVRHIVVTSNGDIISADMRRGVVLYRDTSGDGVADQEHVILGGAGGSGLLLAPGAIYFGTNDSVVRIPFQPGQVKPSGPVETVARGLPAAGHNAKGLSMGADGSLFVSFGSLTNSCQKKGEDRSGP